MITEYKDSNLQYKNGIQKLRKIIKSTLVYENQNADKILQLISYFKEIRPNDVQPEASNDESLSSLNSEQFVFNFSTVILEILEYALNQYFHSDESNLIELSFLCLHNINLLAQNQLKEFDLNPFLRIIYMCYYDGIYRENTLKIFPISTITSCFSPFLKSDIKKYGNYFLRCFYTFCTFPHTIKDSEMIFNEIDYIKDYITDNESIQYICQTLNQMIIFDTFPADLFKKSNFPNYLINLIISKDRKINKDVLILIGRTMYKEICLYETLTWGFFFDLLFENSDNEQVFTIILWILSLCLTKEFSNDLIESDKLNEIVDLYPESTINSKIEISLFVCDVLILTNEYIQEYLTYDILSLMVDTFNIGNNEAVKRMAPILENIIVTLKNPNDEMIDLYKVLDYLFENDILEALEQLRVPENESFEVVNRLYLLLEELIE